MRHPFVLRCLLPVAALVLTTLFAASCVSGKQQYGCPNPVYHR